ncbi:retrovirus-related pol polyprotein from transposon TNT 1-94 [Tanacetum coccineum]
MLPLKVERRVVDIIPPRVSEMRSSSIKSPLKKDDVYNNASENDSDDVKSLDGFDRDFDDDMCVQVLYTITKWHQSHGYDKQWQKTKNIAYNVVIKKTTYDLIKALSNMYEKPSASNKVFLIRQLVNTKMKEGASIADHVNEFNSILSWLMSVDIKFDNEVQALFLLSSLPESWEDISRKTSGEYSNSLISTKEKGRGRKQDIGQKQNRGRSKLKKRAQSKNRQDITCWNCNQKGHFQNQCLKPVASRDKEVNMAARDSDDALVCCMENTIEDRIMDSGASFHATYCKEELERFQLRFDKVCLADDKSLDIAAIGDVVLKTYLLDEEGYHVGFRDQQWKVTKGSLVVARGNKHGSLIGMNMLASKGNVLDVRKVDIYFSGVTVGSRNYDTIIEYCSRSHHRAKSTGLRVEAPKILWVDSVSISYLIYRIPYVLIGLHILEEEWQGKDTSLAHLKVFGCDSYVKVKDVYEEAIKCTFIGSDSDEMRYNFRDTKTGKKASQSLWMFKVKEEQNSSERYYKKQVLGYVLTVGVTTVEWESRLQKSITMLTIEVNFMANPVFHSRMKHIKIRYHYIRRLVGEGTLSLKKILGAKKLADMLTKVVRTEKLKLCVASTGL